MHDYVAFGLSIRSELSFPELTVRTDGSPPSVRISRGVVAAGSVAPTTSSATGSNSYVEVRPQAGETLCAYEGVGRFLVRGGAEITVDAEAGVDAALVRHALVGPVMAPLLWQRGLFTLHASVVVIAGKAVAFVAASGEGKSTVAAAHYFAGCTLVSDDIAVLPWQSAPIVVAPAFPRLRAFPDTLRGLGQDADGQPRVHSLLDKCSVIVERFATASLPLSAVYVIETGPAHAIVPLAKKDALMQLMKHSYAAYQLAPIVGFGVHMKMAARVAEQVPCYRLLRRREFAALPELVRSLQAHAAALAA